MKSTNLERLTSEKFNVPPFIWTQDFKEEQLSFSKAQYFAVRSSFEGEDGEAFSYAGQFETILNVARHQVAEAVEKVQASYQSKEVQAYRKAHGLTKQEGGYVIIQEMVQAQYSGVLFTANPQGLMNEIVLVVGEGLGSKVVEDQTPTTTYYYNVDDDLYYYETQITSPLLEQRVVLELIENGKKIEQLFGQKMDIEFAVADEKVYILQARPITVIGKGEAIVLDHSNIVESYPGVSLPATQDFVKEVYYRVFKSCLMRLTKETHTVTQLESQLRHMVDVANGRIYYRISNWYDVILLLPFNQKIVPIWQQMLGVGNKQVVSQLQDKISRRTRAKVGLSFFNLLFTNPKKMQRLNAYFERVMPTYTKRFQESNEPKVLLALFNEMLEDLGSKWDMTLVNDMYAFIFTAMAQKKYPNRIQQVQKLESLKPIQSLEQLSQIAEQYGMDSEAYQKAKAKHIEDYGDRCLEELKLETRSVRVEPERLDASIEQAIAQGIKCEATNSHEQVTSREVWYVKKAKLGIRNREISRLNRSRLFGIARGIMLKIGTCLVEKKVIENKEDIFYLHYNEMLEVLDTYTPRHQCVAQRKEQYAMYKQLPAYSRLVFDGKIVNKAPLNVNNQSFITQASWLQGIPCSEGIVQGEVLVIEHPQEMIDTRGKILVTQTTDPGWVFLIKGAKGIIAEKGSLLSHTAIVTRELKKPSIVGVKHVTNVLKTGDYIQMNGITGEITKVDKH